MSLIGRRTRLGALIFGKKSGRMGIYLGIVPSARWLCYVLERSGKLTRFKRERMLWIEEYVEPSDPKRATSVQI